MSPQRTHRNALPSSSSTSSFPHRTPPSLRAAEIQALSVPASTGKGNPQDDLSEFYTRFDRINKVHADRQANANGAGQEPELRSFLRSLEELVASDGLEHVTLEDGEEEVIDRASFHPSLPTRRTIDLGVWGIALDTLFTGEESVGRYLDLYIPHTQFVNLKSARRSASPTPFRKNQDRN